MDLYSAFLFALDNATVSDAGKGNVALFFCMKHYLKKGLYSSLCQKVLAKILLR